MHHERQDQCRYRWSFPYRSRPLIALTVLGHAVHPYLDRIAQNVDQAREAAQAMADVRRSTFMPLPPSRLSSP